MIENKSVKNNLYLAPYVFLVGLFLLFIKSDLSLLFLAASIIGLFWASINYFIKKDKIPEQIKVMSDKEKLVAVRIMLFFILLVSIMLLYDFLRPR